MSGIVTRSKRTPKKYLDARKTQVNPEWLAWVSACKCRSGDVHISCPDGRVVDFIREPEDHEHGTAVMDHPRGLDRLSAAQREAGIEIVRDAQQTAEAGIPSQFERSRALTVLTALWHSGWRPVAPPTPPAER